MPSSLPWFFAFDHLPTTAGTNPLRTAMLGDEAFSSINVGGSGTQIVSDGALSRRVLEFSISNWQLQATVPATLEICHGFRYRTTQNSDPVVHYRVGSTDKLHIRISGGLIQVMRGGTTLATGATTVTDGNWRYWEVAIEFDGSAGSVEIRLDGVSEISISGVNTSNTSGDVTNLRWIPNAASGTGAITDFYIRDTLEFYGPITMRRLLPASDVSVEWTRDSGSANSDRVADSSGTDGDTSYIETDTLGDRDIYTLDDLPSSANSVIAVVAYTVGVAPDGGAPLVQHGLRHDSTVALGTARAVGTSSYGTQINVFTEKPGGGALSKAVVDAMDLVIDAA